jgi:hypothetical protein
MNEHGVLAELLLLRKPCFTATLSTTNPVWTGLHWIQAFGVSDRPTTIYGMAGGPF